MTGQQAALEAVKGLMDSGMSLDDANVELVRIMGVRLIQAKMDRRTRSALMAGVKSGKIGHLAKSGIKPEAFFHPNGLDNAKEERTKVANAAIRAIASVCA
jgi:uncharacterized protein YoaH (UPF0181 family)